MAEIVKQKALAQFNKLNGEFVAVHSGVPDYNILNHKSYDYREVEIDLSNEDIVGTIDNFEIVNVNEGPVEITEDMVDELARNRITKAYPLERQLSIMGQMLEKLADQAGVDATDLKEMNDYITEAKRVNKIRKQFYMDNPDYVYKTNQEVEDKIERKFEGIIQASDG